MCSNKTSHCRKDLPDCQQDLPREERLAPKNGKSAAKIFKIPRGKDMLPICDTRQNFLTTPAWHAGDMRPS
jgi:hypothetical protein